MERGYTVKEEAGTRVEGTRKTVNAGGLEKGEFWEKGNDFKVTFDRH